MTKLFVDAWDPSYGSSFEGDGDGPSSPSSAQVETDVEVPAAQWAPIDVGPSVHCPDVVLLVDGVRRNEAMLWTEEDDGQSYPGLAASFAAGVVRCDLRNGLAELLPGARVGRGLFTASPSVEDVVAGSVRYEVHRVSGTGEASKLAASVQGPLTALEIGVSEDAQRDGSALLVLDGPLRGRRMPRAIGYVKTQEKKYLPANLSLVVTSLRAGQRTPVFRLVKHWPCWTWYLRLPGTSGAPWAGIVRIECPPDFTVEQAIELAHLSAATLPRLASSPYKDPRAPQNLVPIAGLERRLRGLLGDARVLHRALTMASVRTR